RFREDPDCRAFLSTDAGGTGLNLQAADTVVNVDVPWNPAVLDQRIARVHRMGQHRPVQVINLVTRGSIEERVLRTLTMKRTLFEGVFTGGSDEVGFQAVGHQAFMDTMRQLTSEEEPPPPPAPQENASPQAAADPRQVLIQAGVQFLETVAGLFAGNGQAVAGVLGG